MIDQNYKYYQRVATEIEKGKFDGALRVKAFAEAQGNEEKAKALYIKLRVEALRLHDCQVKLEEKNAQIKQKEKEKKKHREERQVKFQAGLFNVFVTVSALVLLLLLLLLLAFFLLKG